MKQRDPDGFLFRLFCFGQCASEPVPNEAFVQAFFLTHQYFRGKFIINAIGNF